MTTNDPYVRLVEKLYETGVNLNGKYEEFLLNAFREELKIFNRLYNYG